MNNCNTNSIPYWGRLSSYLICYNLLQLLNLQQIENYFIVNIPRIYTPKVVLAYIPTPSIPPPYFIFCNSHNFIRDKIFGLHAGSIKETLGKVGENFLAGCCKCNNRNRLRQKISLDTSPFPSYTRVG